MKRDPEAFKAALEVLFDAGMSLDIQAKAFGLSKETIKNYRYRFGLQMSPRVKADLSDGEWVHLPKWDLYVRRDGTLANAQSLTILKPSKVRSRMGVTVDMGDRRTTVTVDRALRAAFGANAAPMNLRGNRWSPADEEKLRDCRTWADAIAAFPDRTEVQVRDKGKRMGLHKPALSAKRPEGLNIAVLTREATAAVPRGIPHDERDDLISDLVMMRLEGRREPFATLLKEARRERNRVMGAWKERSLDAQIGDHEGFTMMDRLDSEGRVW